MLLLLLVLPWLPATVAATEELETPESQIRDLRSHSYADLSTHVTTHLHLNLTIDMEREELEGFVEIFYVRVGVWEHPQYRDQLLLDMGEALTIESVWEMEGGRMAEQLTHHVVCRGDNVWKCALYVTERDTSLGSKVVRIYYRTTNKSPALMFVQPQQVRQDKFDHSV